MHRLVKVVFKFSWHSFNICFLDCAECGAILPRSRHAAVSDLVLDKVKVSSKSIVVLSAIRSRPCDANSKKSKNGVTFNRKVV